MEFLIKIDRASIKKNNASNDEYVPIRYNLFIELIGVVPSCLHDYLTQLDTRLVSISAPGDWKRTSTYAGSYKMVPNAEAILAECKKYCSEVNWNESVDYQHIQILGYEVCPYDYKFLETIVECKSCGSRFTNLELNSVCEDDYDAYSDSVCPKCHEWDCCDLKYEDIYEVVSNNGHQCTKLD